MKKIIFIAMMLLGLGVNAQTMEKGYLSHLLDSEKMVNTKYDMFPKATKVIVRRRHVVVVFDRNDWERMRLIGRGRTGRRRFLQ
jgi:hypothetical protein